MTAGDNATTGVSQLLVGSLTGSCKNSQKFINSLYEGYSRGKQRKLLILR